MRVPNSILAAGSGLWLGLLLWTAAAAPTARGETVELQATLILASNTSAPLDARLDYIEYKLRRVFGFEYYRHYGEGSALLALPGSTELALGHGSGLRLQAEAAGGGRLRVAVRWHRDGQVLLDTTVVMSRGSPVILGGVPQDQGTLIVTLLAR